MNEWIPITMALSAASAAIFSAIGLGVKIRTWIQVSHDSRTESLNALRDALNHRLDGEEELSSARHEQNTLRFHEIEIRLARMGNGRVKEH